MWTPGLDSQTQSFVQSMACDVARAAESHAQSVPAVSSPSLSHGPGSSLDAGSFRAFAPTFQDSVARALCSLAASINSTAPVNRLPAELLCEIARYLPFPSLGRAREVCRHWRDVLDRDPRLWAHIEVHLNDYPPRWTRMLAPLLARSRGFPLRLQLLFHCTSHAAPFQECLKLVCLHLDHTVELSVALPSSALALCCSALSSAAAPVLETFLIIANDGTADRRVRNLPEGLFAGHAPRLHTLYAKGVFVSATGGVALSRLRSITYDHFPAPAPVSAIVTSLERCTSLEWLVLVTGAVADAADAAPPPARDYPSLKTLLFTDTHDGGTTALLEHFRAVPTTVLSYGNHAAAAASGAPRRLAALFSKSAACTELDVRIRPSGVFAQPPQTPLCAVAVDGALVAVDVGARALHAVLADAHLAALERLALPLPLSSLVVLAWPRLRALRRLALYADARGRWENVLPAPLAPHAPPLALDTLSLVGARAMDAVAWRDAVLRVVAALCGATAGRIRLLELRGFPELALSQEELDDYVDEFAVEEAVQEESRPGWGPWCWNMGKDNAIHM